MTTTLVLPQVKPMLASPPKRERPADLQGTHAFDLKLDGIRALLYWDGVVEARLVNRSGKDITHRFPEIDAAVTMSGLPPMVLDGEVVARSGSFQDVATRDKQSDPAVIARGMHANPCTYVAFDIPFWQDADLRHRPFQYRRQALELAHLTHVGVALTTSVLSLDSDYFETVKSLGMEGVIAKRLTSSYRAGRFSDWIKFKAVRSITAIGIGYEKGTGAREHFGAMFLALVGPDGPVEIGRVGTGFTAQEIATLKDSLDAGTPVVCEIECLNVSKDGKLRFPVYKAMRTDVDIHAATLAQLDDIPRM